MSEWLAAIADDRVARAAVLGALVMAWLWSGAFRGFVYLVRLIRERPDGTPRERFDRAQPDAPPVVELVDPDDPEPSR